MSADDPLEISWEMIEARLPANWMLVSMALFRPKKAKDVLWVADVARTDGVKAGLSGVEPFESFIDRLLGKISEADRKAGPIQTQ